MQIHVVDSRFSTQAAPPAVLLERSRWDDHGYRTMFRAFFLSAETHGAPTPLGRIKILQKGQKTPALPAVFDRLDASFCSLGQEVEYYSGIRDLVPAHAEDVLRALRDLALDPTLEQDFRDDPGLRTSLFRFPNAEIACERARALFSVQAAKHEIPLRFTFTCQLKFDSPHVVEFSFPEPKQPLGRIMPLVGRNGCGKTQLLGRLGLALSGLDPGQALEPQVHRPVVAISFNAFDGFTPPRDNLPGGAYRYYGLRAPPTRGMGQQARTRSSLDHALKGLERSLRQIWTLGEAHQREWREFLDSSGLFSAEPDLADPFEGTGKSQQRFQEQLDAFIDRLGHASAGHQFLTFVVTALVESVRKDTVVLLDELETHVHPRLLSTIIRLLADFLLQRDAFAVLATHSPLVLQELPARAIRLIRLSDRHPIIQAYPRESFGENLDDIIRDAFGVEENDRYYATLLRALTKSRDRAAIEQLFNGLGLGARMLLRELAEGSADP